MPTYWLSCDGCAREWEEWCSIHDELPTEHVGDGEMCGPIHQILTAPVVRSAEGKRIIDGDAELAKDRDAYKRLRASGLQPKQINGSAVYERHADTQFEVETGYLFPDKAAKKKVAEARRRADDYVQATAPGFKK